MSTPSPRRTRGGSSRPMTERTVTGPAAGPTAGPAAPRPPAPDDAPPTARPRAQAQRRAALRAAAARLFARRGFDGVSLEDLGSAAGISGPAVYRHFPSKQAVLAALLVEASERLLVGGRAVVDTAADDAERALGSLIRFHVDFATTDPDVIRVQERDLPALSAADREHVRGLQRSYVDLWVDVLARLSPRTDRPELRLRAQATFGLLNSTPFSARGLTPSRTRELLAEMAQASLGRLSR